MDIDLFKQVNDLHGHEAGDFVLTKLTESLIEMLDDEQVFRLGGGVCFTYSERQERELKGG